MLKPHGLNHVVLQQNLSTKAILLMLDCRSVTDVSETKSDSSVTLRTNERDIQAALRDFLSSPLGSHKGVFKTLKRIRTQYKWKGKGADVLDDLTNFR